MLKENLPLAAVVLAASLLGACGQKGPLYLPQDASADNSTLSPQAATPADEPTTENTSALSNTDKEDTDKPGDKPPPPVAEQ